jgi:outer membrane biosynthesis protein TonB
MAGGVLDFISHGSFAKVLGDGAAIERETAAAIAGLTPQPSDALGGLGAHGELHDGRGESIPVGGITTVGRSGGHETYGVSQGDIGAKRETEIRVDDTAPIVHGSLDPSLIKRVIQENRNAIRYCYEREMQIHKGLEGTIRTQFVIGADGAVTSAVIKESTMGSAAVESCVAAKLRALIFPKPMGGGIVIVNYPFVFKAAN